MAPQKVLGAATFHRITALPAPSLAQLRTALEEDNRSYVIATASDGSTLVGVGERFAELTLPARGADITYFDRTTSRSQRATVDDVRACNPVRATLDALVSIFYAPPDPIPAALADLGAVDVWHNVPV